MKASTIIIRLLLAIIPLGIYIASLYQPALLFEQIYPLPGHHILAWGWWGAMMLNFAWFANGTFFASLFYYIRGHFKPAIILSLVTILLALKSFITKEWWFGENTGTPIT